VHDERPGRRADFARRRVLLLKRTYVFALYAKLWNGRSAQYNNIDGINVPPGADPQQLALGITHNF
jgi:hypothetical protein